MAQTLVIAVNDPNIRYLLQRYAEESGFHALSIAHGGDIHALLARHAPTAQPAGPALFVLDADSWDAWSEKVRQAATSRQIPVVIYSCAEETPNGAPEGVTGYLPRTVMYDDFLAELERAGLAA